MTSVLRQSILTVYYLMIAKDKDLSCFQMITAGRRVDYFHLLDPQWTKTDSHSIQPASFRLNSISPPAY